MRFRPSSVGAVLCSTTDYILYTVPLNCTAGKFHYIYIYKCQRWCNAYLHIYIYTSAFTLIKSQCKRVSFAAVSHYMPLCVDDGSPQYGNCVNGGKREFDAENCVRRINHFRRPPDGRDDNGRPYNQGMMFSFKGSKLAFMK